MWHDVRSLNAATNALLGLFALVLLAAGLWWTAQRPMFTLRSIRIEGIDTAGAPVHLRHIDPLTVRASAVRRIRGNFFTANLDSVRQAFETVPWVRRATVRREWPNRLVVQLEEHMPLGTWGDDGRLVSVKGEIFTANLAEAEEDAALAAFEGPDGSEKELVARYQQMRDWFAPVNLAPEALALSHRYAWSVRLNNGMRVELGKEQGTATLQQRVDRFVKVYPRLITLLQDRIESVDMRYQNGLALQASGLTLSTDKGTKKAKKQ